MAILRVKDENGNITDIPAIKGDSAYEIALKNGFEGTEAEWLESLKGTSGEQLLFAECNILENAFLHAAPYYSNSMVIEAELPSGARAKRILIPDLVTSGGDPTDSFINIEDMITIAGQETYSYCITYPKDMPGFYGVGKNIAIINFLTETNEFYNLVISGTYAFGTIKIYYTIEEN